MRLRRHLALLLLSLLAMGDPAITGTARVRQTLQANVGTWDGAPAPDFALVWERCNGCGVPTAAASACR
jgi:hypothetical protein